MESLKEYKNMVKTHIADALKNSYESFSELVDLNDKDRIRVSLSL